MPHVLRTTAARVAARARALLPFAALALGGCFYYGTRAEQFGPALRPEGATVAVRLRGERADRVGELFAVDTLGLLLNTGRLTRVPWERLESMDVAKLGDGYDVAPRSRVDEWHRDRLALVSRFPQGLSGELLARVLAALRQSDVEVVP
jgi:hypothetical protein